MADLMVGGALLSSFINVLFDRLASKEVLDFLRGNKLNLKLLKRLKTMLLPTNALLNDAEEKQLGDNNVKNWLDEHKEVLYEADHVMDKNSTEALRLKMEEDELESTASMDSDDVFDHYQAVAASSIPKKDGKRARGESSKTPSKKARTDDAPATAPSKENTPPPPPTEQTTPTPANPQPSSRAADKEALDNSSEGSLPSLVVGSAREMIYKLSKHRRSQAAITETASMEADQVVNRGLNEIVSGLLTLTAGSRRIGALVSQGRNFDSRLAQAKEVFEVDKDKLLEENKELSRQYEQMCEDQAILTKELQDAQEALKKANEAREKWRESSVLVTQECKQLGFDLTASREEKKKLEERVQELEEEGAKNLKKSKEATHLCFYEFWKHNREANFNYLTERLKRTLMAQCAIWLEAEEKAKAKAPVADAETGPPADQSTPSNPEDPLAPQ
ncbi:uncharacterized protein LOC133783371 [Humulus lupulus]|uniref:uncharacterized protein LOC133783371 n=1 Tax=Humulus lupulus TaxID=3486 RepID=UPI002B406E74|nr:uncharacterized protein LOC133783371 [Humulus lupulus]